MNAQTLSGVLDAWGSNRAVELLARTTHAMRADPGFVQRDDDLASAVFLEEETPAGLDADALNRVLGEIDAADAADAEATSRLAGGAFADEIAGLPSPVRDAALDAIARDASWTFAGLGIQRLALFDDDGAHAILMRITPGYGVSEHDHEGEELTLVLTGAYNDGADAYRPGDVSVARPGFVHTPKAEPGEVCYVLLAFRGAPKFKGWMGLIQRWFGFPARLTGAAAA
ncbi:MAG TPA: cupin domain-containing protein [Caulobacteraceae bacterium]|nr:cupin domain-containing protein [Caulobacteraceae bacterium]